jgi:V8-like Glu-specific endopeptidase
MKINKLRTGFVVIGMLLTIFSGSLRADEGMWLISLISKNIEEMQRLGLKLTAEDIYSINQSSLKDAVVQLDDGGCSAEIISPMGLVLTNHHCAVADIQHHSSAEKNLLRHGFWASNYEEELHVPGKTALILLRVEDVTERVKSMVTDDDYGYLEQVANAMAAISSQVAESEKGTHVKVVQMFNYNQFFLFVYHRFTDVRLVGAPPSSIGNFGGDVDNWRWPRHTGDFALFRIYASPDGSPADYSKNNKPYQPKHHFTISLEGLNEGDFTMVIGFPGTTHRYSSSFHAAHERDVVAPWVDNVWGEFIGTIKNAMQTNESIKVGYTDTHDMLVNFWQKDTYQAKSMFRFNVVEHLRQREDSLKAWAASDSMARFIYTKSLFPIESYFRYVQNNQYEQQLRSINALIYWPTQVGDKIYESSDFIMTLINESNSKRKIRKEAKKFSKSVPTLFQNYFPTVDERLYSLALNSFISSLPDDDEDPLFTEIRMHEYPQIIVPILVNHFYQNSYFTSQNNLMNFLKKPVIDSLGSDPLFMLHLKYEYYNEKLQGNISPFKSRYDLAMHDFTKGILEMENDKLHYPDANSTMRLSYGKVIGYSPNDAIHYKPFTYLGGVIEKEDPNVAVFEVPTKLKNLWMENDFGPYANSDGMPVCFITDNDITNGNSGSPVLNANGHLVGVAFDGNYEAMACDFVFEPSIQRTIVADIRYVLFVIDKFAGAKHLIREMTIIK